MNGVPMFSVFRVVTRARAVIAVTAAIGVLVALVALVGTGLGSGADPRSRVRFAAGWPPVAPAADLAWWEPVPGEPIGLTIDDGDVAVAALDEVRLVDGTTGRTRWTAAVPGVRRYRPALGADRVAATTETELVVLDRDDGARVATVAFPGPGPAAVLASAGPGGVVVAGSETGRISAVDARDGVLQWSAAYPGMVTVAPRGDATTVVAAWHGGPDAMLRAFDVRTGVVRWQVPLGPVAGPPLLVGDAVVVASGAGIHAAVVQSLDLATGRSRRVMPLAGWWEEEIDGTADPSTVYLLDGMGTVVALDPASGALRWRRETDRPLTGSSLTCTNAAHMASDLRLLLASSRDGSPRFRTSRGLSAD